MARTKAVEVHPQTVLKGQTIRSKDTGKDEVVRSVSVVLHLANGYDEAYDDGESVQLVEAERVEFPKELIDGISDESVRHEGE